MNVGKGLPLINPSNLSPKTLAFRENLNLTSMLPQPFLYLCGMEMIKGVCKVCELVDNDTSIKGVFYCSSCRANICLACKPNFLKRAKAVILLHSPSKQGSAKDERN